MPLGKMEFKNGQDPNEMVRDEGLALDLKSTENLNQAEYKKVADFLNKFMEKAITDEENQDEIAKAYSDGDDMDTWTESRLSNLDEEFYASLTGALATGGELESLGGPVRTELQANKREVLKSFREKDFRLSIVGADQIADELLDLANDQTDPKERTRILRLAKDLRDNAKIDHSIDRNVINRPGTPERGREKHPYRVPLSKGRARQILRTGEKTTEQMLDSERRGTDVYYKTNMYLDPHEVQAGYMPKVSKLLRLNENNKPKVRRALMLFLDNENPSERDLTRANLPLMLFKKKGGYMEVMRGIQDAVEEFHKDSSERTDTDADQRVFEDRIASMVLAGDFSDMNRKDLEQLGMTQKRKGKMLKILQRAKWDDLLELSAVLTNSQNVEEGIASIFRAEAVTGQLKTEKKRFQEASEKMEDAIDENNVMFYLFDWNLDSSISAGQDKYEDGKKIRKIRRKELKFLGDVGPQFGQSALAARERSRKELDLIGNPEGMGTEMVNQNTLREIYGQITLSGYLSDEMGYSQYAQLEADIKDLIGPSGLVDCTDAKLAELVKTYPMFHVMFKHAIFALGGGDETSEAAPSPVNLDDIFKGEVLKTMEQGRSKAEKMLRNAVDTYFENGENDNLVWLIKEQGEVRAKHMFITAVLKTLNEVMVQQDLDNVADFIEADAAKTGAILAIAKNLPQLILNRHKGGALRITIPIAKGEKFFASGAGKVAGQVFGGIGFKEGTIPGTKDFTMNIGARGEILGRLTKAENVNLLNPGASHYLGAEAEAKAELNLTNIVDSDLKVSAGVKYSREFLQNIKDAERVYDDAMQQVILKDPDMTKAMKVNGSFPTTRAGILQSIDNMKRRAELNLASGKGIHKFIDKNAEKLQQNIDVIFGMLKNQFDRDGMEEYFSPESVTDLMLSLHSGNVKMWRDGAIAQLHGKLKLTGISAGVSVDIIKAAMGPVGAATTLATGRTPVDVYVGFTVATWKAKHNVDVKQKIDRQNKVMRGMGGDPFEGQPEKQTAEYYAKYYKALFNSEHLDVTAETAADGTSRLVFDYTRDEPATIQEFLNLHATPDALKDNLFAIEGNRLTVGAKYVSGGTINEPKGTTRFLMIGGPIITKQKGLMKPNAMPVLITNKDINDVDEVPFVKDTTTIRWTPEKITDVKTNLIPRFLNSLPGGEKSAAIKEALKTKLEEMADNGTLALHGKYTFEVDRVEADGAGRKAILKTPSYDGTDKGNLTFDLKKFEVTEKVSDVKKENLVALTELLFSDDNVGNIENATAKQDFMRQRTAIMTAVQNALTSEGDAIKKIKHIHLIHNPTDHTFSVDFDKASSHFTGQVKASVSYSVERVNPDSDEIIDLGAIEYNYSGALETLSRRIDAVWKDLANVNRSKVWNNPDYYSFMEAASNIDNPASSWFQLDEGEMNQALGKLASLLRSTDLPSMRDIADKLYDLNDWKSKVAVMNRFKQILAYNKGLHTGKVSMTHLLNARKETYKRLKGPSGDPISPALAAIFDVQTDRWISRDPGRGNYTNTTDNGLVGYAAFYRDGGAPASHVKKKNKAWSSIGPGRTDVLNDFRTEITDENGKDVVRREMFKNQRQDKFRQEMVAAQVKAHTGDALDGYQFPETEAELKKFTTELLGSRNGVVKLKNANGDTESIQFDLGYEVGLEGPCGNRYYGFRIKGLKIRGTTTTTEAGRNVVEATPFTQERPTEIVANAVNDDFVTVDAGDWSVKGEDYSASADTDADKYNFSYRLGIPTFGKPPVGPVVGPTNVDTATETGFPDVTGGGISTGTETGDGN